VPAVTVVIPFFNEAESCRALLTELRGVTNTLPGGCEVIAVDDGSRDETPAILQAVAAEWPDLRVLRLAANSGQAPALFTGMRAARAPVVVTMDGDGQNVPSDIPLLVSRLTEADMVAGVRAQRQDSWLRRRMSRIANGVRSRLLGDGMTDSGCALKAFRREVVDAFLPMRTLYSFMPALAVAAGFKVVEQPVQHRERRAGVSKYGLLVMLWRPALDMLGIWWWRHRRFPLPQVANDRP
jgi:glycosyltransferase involved in cell wall biosynthesis